MLSLRVRSPGQIAGAAPLHCGMMAACRVPGFPSLDHCSTGSTDSRIGCAGRSGSRWGPFLRWG